MFVAELELLAAGKVAQEGAGFSRLRTGIAAGSSVPAELMRRLHREMGLSELCICYGMTETSPVSAMTGPEDGIEERLDSVGRAMPHVQLKVVDPASGRQDKVVEVGRRGELWVSGYLVMKGYWDDEERTREALVEDEEGRVWMRVSDLRNSVTWRRRNRDFESYASTRSFKIGAQATHAYSRGLVMGTLNLTNLLFISA